MKMKWWKVEGRFSVEIVQIILIQGAVKTGLVLQSVLEDALPLTSSVLSLQAFSVQGDWIFLEVVQLLHERRNFFTPWIKIKNSDDDGDKVSPMKNFIPFHFSSNIFFFIHS